MAENPTKDGKKLVKGALTGGWAGLGRAFLQTGAGKAVAGILVVTMLAGAMGAVMALGGGGVLGSSATDDSGYTGGQPSYIAAASDLGFVDADQVVTDEVKVERLGDVVAAASRYAVPWQIIAAVVSLDGGPNPCGLDDAWLAEFVANHDEFEGYDKPTARDDAGTCAQVLAAAMDEHIAAYAATNGQDASYYQLGQGVVISPDDGTWEVATAEDGADMADAAAATKKAWVSVLQKAPLHQSGGEAEGTYDTALGWYLGQAGASRAGVCGISGGTVTVGDPLSASYGLTPSTFGLPPYDVDTFMKIVHNYEIVRDVIATTPGADPRDFTVAVMKGGIESYGGLNLASNAVPESKNYPYDRVAAGDADSVGIFQQRPSQGWGSVADLMRVDYQTTNYLTRLYDLDYMNDYSFRVEPYWSQWKAGNRSVRGPEYTLETRYAVYNPGEIAQIMQGSANYDEGPGKGYNRYLERALTVTTAMTDWTVGVDAGGYLTTDGTMVMCDGSFGMNPWEQIIATVLAGIEDPDVRGIVEKAIRAARAVVGSVETGPIVDAAVAAARAVVPDQYDDVVETAIRDGAKAAQAGPIIEAAIAFAMKQVGEDYQLGQPAPPDGRDASEWDCSGLTQSAYNFALANAGLGSPFKGRRAQDMYSELAQIPFSMRARGDLVFWGKANDRGVSVSHVAIYLGKNPTTGLDMYVEAWGEEWGVVAHDATTWHLTGVMPRVARVINQAAPAA